MKKTSTRTSNVERRTKSQLRQALFLFRVFNVRRSTLDVFPIGFPVSGLAALMLTAIIVAGGSSQRMGFDKLFAPLNGRPVVAHSIAAFEQTESVADIILVGRAEVLSDYEELVRGRGFSENIGGHPGRRATAGFRSARPGSARRRGGICRGA